MIVRRYLVLSVVLLALSLSGCIYSQAQIPLDKDVSKTVLGPKKGEASIHVIAWLFSWGEAGTDAAARAGEIEIINHLDAEYTVVLFGLYSRRTTIAFGE